MTSEKVIIVVNSAGAIVVRVVVTIVDWSVDLAVDSDDESVDIFVLSVGETVIKVLRIKIENVFFKEM